MAKKIDPLNKKNYSSVSVNLNVADIKSAVAFYQKALGFAKRDIMTGPDRKPIHAELTLRGTTLMLSPENPQRGARSAKAMGGSPVTLYLLTSSNERLKPIFLKDLKPSARVVSHDFEIRGWKPVAVNKMLVGGRPHMIYLYRIDDAR